MSSIRAHTKKKKHLSLITSLPDDLIVDILVRVPRCDYQTLSLVSKYFRSLIMSRRSFLGCTKACLCVVMDNPVTSNNRLYVLCQKANSNRHRLVLMQSLPFMYYYEGFVTVGSKIYVFRCIGRTSSVLSIDCISHTVQLLPEIPMPMVVKFAGIIEGKIYVIGYSSNDSKKKAIVVFNTETQMWEPEITKLDIELGRLWYGCVVIKDTMYMRDSHNSFVYKPKENKLETEEMLNSKSWSQPCVLDDLLYYYDFDENELRTYDPKEKHWGVVKGVGRLIPETSGCWRSRTVNYGEKLVVFFQTYYSISCARKIWCAEIALEKHKEIEIWGKVEWCEAVFEGYFNLTDCIAVMV